MKLSAENEIKFKNIAAISFFVQDFEFILILMT